MKKVLFFAAAAVTLIKKLLLLFGHLVKEEYDIEDLDHKVAPHKVKWGESSQKKKKKAITC